VINVSGHIQEVNLMIHVPGTNTVVSAPVVHTIRWRSVRKRRLLCRHVRRTAGGCCEGQCSLLYLVDLITYPAVRHGHSYSRK
jgi:hypothetical protein